MKKAQYIFAFLAITSALLVITSTVLISCENKKKIATSDDIGTYAFSLLEGLENSSEQEYINSLYTYEELRAYTKNNSDKLAQEFKDNVAVLSKENYNSRTKIDYKNLKEIAASNGIKWSDIEPINFRYWPRAKNGIKSIKGDLFFTHNQQTYKVIVTSFDTGNGYIVSKIDKLEKLVN